MTPRSIRRAQERKARKEMDRKARKEFDRKAPEEVERRANPETPRPDVLCEAFCCEPELTGEAPTGPTLFNASITSAARVAANQANSQLSTGPITPQGKATSSLNAVKTALTGRTVLLPSDDAPAYQQHVLAYTDDFHPVGERECDLVQSIADSAWRLKRIPGLETAIFAQGHIEFAETFNNHDARLRASMIELQTYLKYEKHLRNLQLQESRLARRREKEIAELRQLQQERREAEKQGTEAEHKTLERAPNWDVAAQAAAKSVKQPANGFVFSNVELEQHPERSQSLNTAEAGASSDQNRELVTAEAA